jgi:sugar lactone lactonase YvrE
VGREMVLRGWWALGGGRIAVALAVVGATAATLAPGASAAGQFTYLGCVRELTAANACGASRGLTDAAGLAVSPDGSSVYSTSATLGAVTRFAVQASGNLAFQSCFADGAADGCANPDFGHDPLANAIGVAVSPDGKSVYVASYGSDAVARFDRAADGALTYRGCVADTTADGCAAANGANTPLQGTDDVAVSPDGENVYVSSSDASSITRFARAADGALTYQGCTADGGAHGCANPTPGEHPLHNVQGITISPDGASLYAAGFDSNSLMRFARNASTGQLSYRQCFSDGGAEGCTSVGPGVTPLESAIDVVVSPDGRSVYTAAPAANAIAEFARSSDGTLTYRGCLGGPSGSGCPQASPGNDAISGVEQLGVAPDSRTVLAASFFASSVSRFAPDPGGALRFVDCFSDAGFEGCADPLAGSAVINSALTIALDPAGTAAYVGTNAGTIAAFRLDTVAPQTRMGRSRIRKRRRMASFRFSSSEAGSTFLCALDAGKLRRCRSPRVYRHLRGGRHRFRVEAIDAAGNVDQSPAVRRFRIPRRHRHR